MPSSTNEAPVSNDPTARVRQAARDLGFDAVGIARADVELDPEFARYEAFVDAGMHGEMRWLGENREARRRVDTDAILLGAKSVICVARRYQRNADDEARDPELARSIARYARGRDYHNGVRKKLRKIAAFVRALGTEDAPVQARPLCDDAPVLERAWAARAGLGFIGKNGLIIVPGEGSFVLLGEVVTTLALVPDAPMTERCGSCTRCLDACPTGAFPAPFVLDPRRCVAYLTIEHRSEIAEELRAPIGEHLFGCDDCQTVCPFNRSARPRDPSTTRPFEPHPRWGEVDLATLVSMDADGWSQVREGTPVSRATAPGLARNAAIVLGNRGAEEGERGRAADEALREAAARHPASLVRDAAAWALERRGAKPEREGGD